MPGFFRAEEAYLLLLLPLDFFSPPWLDRLLFAPPEALAPLDDFESEEDDLRLGDEDVPEDLLPDFMICSLKV